MKNFNVKMLLVLIGLISLLFLTPPARADLIDVPDININNPEPPTNKVDNQAHIVCKPGEKMLTCTYLRDRLGKRRGYDGCKGYANNNDYYFLKDEKNSIEGKEYYCEKPKRKSSLPPVVWLFLAGLSTSLLYIIRLNRLKQK